MFGFFKKKETENDKMKNLILTDVETALFLCQNKDVHEFLDEFEKEFSLNRDDMLYIVTMLLKEMNVLGTTDYLHFVNNARLEPVDKGKVSLGSTYLII